MPRAIMITAMALIISAGISYAQVQENIIGFTQYDMQTNGSTGNRIALADDGTIYCTWMNGHPFPATRGVYYNVRTPSGNWLYPPDGIGISPRNGGGYPQIALNNSQMPVIAFHYAPTNNESLYVAIDTSWGYGNFQFFKWSNRFSNHGAIWPNISVGRNGIFHIISTTISDVGQSRYIVYNQSTDGGQSWSSLRLVDTVTTMSAIITSSRVSNRTAIVYCAPIDTSLYGQSDICYVESSEGNQWDFTNGIVNITDYGTDSDSIAAFNDCDAIYDYNDNLHIIWDARPVTADGFGYDDRLLHFSRNDGSISEMSRFSESWPDAGCEFGANNWSYAKMSLGAKSNNDLFAIYTTWDSTNCSAGGYANGELYFTWSEDGGLSWGEQELLTPWQSPNCYPGSCNSSHWSSLAEKVDDYLHIIYIDDKDAGAVPQTEGYVTDSPVYYLEYPVPESSVKHGIETPQSITLSQNYPNPFNSHTAISFILNRRENIKLEIFDILGARVATLLNEPKEAGSYVVNWDADKVASGNYYYRLSTSEGAITKQMALVK